MIDIHLHFDGSLSLELVARQARKQNLPYANLSEEELRDRIVCPLDCASLNDFLARFEIPLEILQTADSLSEAVEAVLGTLKSQGILYAELRFAPQHHTRKGLTQEEAVLAALEGLKKGLSDGKIMAQLILCAMRGDGNDAANFETLELAAKYLHRGVCAFDLAGAEALFPTERYRALFARATEMGVPFTIHAGEAAGPESVRAALSFGAKRIGHGTHAIEDPALVEELKEKQVVLECCVISNVQSKSVESIEKHPVKYYMEQGLKVTLNTDNMTISQTSMAREVSYVREKLGLTPAEEKQLYLNAVDGAFLDEESKEELKHAVAKAF
ncbi:MAG: adenosine deaminase [Lachnospiraceae bacterium]|nr:adenosine deaminase [Lachnospiraceae bacterium]